MFWVPAELDVKICHSHDFLFFLQAADELAKEGISVEVSFQCALFNYVNF